MPNFESWTVTAGIPVSRLLGKAKTPITVLNGHIHQTMRKVGGNVTLHTAMSTAFAQPKPGGAPGPMKVPQDQMRSMLGLTSVRYVQGEDALALVDSSLA
jgi:Icc protein